MSAIRNAAILYCDDDKNGNLQIRPIFPCLGNKMKFNNQLPHALLKPLFCCLLTLFSLSYAGSVLAQNNPLFRPTTTVSSQSGTTDGLPMQTEADATRINTLRILAGQSNLRVNTVPTTSTDRTVSTPMMQTVPVQNTPIQNGAEGVSNTPLLLQYSQEQVADISSERPVGLHQQSVDEPRRISPLYNSDQQPLLPLQIEATTTPVSSQRQLKSLEQAQIEEVLQKGAILEKDGRWYEAQTLYENAIRTFHKPPILMQRFRFARFHHDLTRRYNDTSFDMLLRQMSYSDAMALYDEVITKIQLSHIDPPHWDELFENGMKDFEIAMADPAFHLRHLSKIDSAKTATLSQTIIRITQGWDIRDSKTLRYAVIAIADTCQKEIGLNPTAVVLEFLAGMTNSLDPYTEFMTLNQYNDTQCTISGNFVGLGVELKADRKSLYINRVIPGSPAERGGLRNLDRILYVDGTPTEGLPLETASNLLQGAVNTTVRLIVLSSDNKQHETMITREHLKVPSVENVHILNEHSPGLNIGYFRLIGFQRDTVQEIHDALIHLNHLGMQALIIDLRGNAGGVLTESIAAADLFLKQGVIVRTKNRGPMPEYVYSATTKSFTWDMPLAVLIDKDSASASEIFAGAIGENHRGLIVGQPSFGKDTVQAVIPLTGGRPQNMSPIAGLRLTIETYYSPNGTSFFGIGVQPDIFASNTASNLASNTATYHQVNRISEDDEHTLAQQPIVQEDAILQTAVESIRQNMQWHQPEQAQSSSSQTLSTRYQPSVN